MDGADNRRSTDKQLPHDQRPFGGRAVGIGRTALGAFVVLLAVVVVLGVQGGLPHWDFGSGAGTPAAEPRQSAMDPVAIAAAVEPELTNITVSIEPGGLAAAGSGIVLTADGQVLTSHHVIKGAEVITVGDLGTGVQYSATVLGYDSAADIALLSLTGAGGLPVVRIGDSATLRPGDQIMAIGNAGGTGRPTATPGTVASLNTSIVARDAADLSHKALTGMVEVNAPVESGQSGGAVVDRGGAVVGVVTAAAGNPSRMGGPAVGYAVPIGTAMTIVRQIRSGTSTDAVHIGPTANLGVLASDTSPSGARIDVSLYGQPAFAAGLAAGEVITAVDDHAVSSAQTLESELGLRKPGDTIRVALTEPDGSHREVAVVLAAGPPR
jgi:S1-C subfamily serine protease